MCIIVAKKKGINIPNEETLRECFNRNSDGAGLMYVKDGKIHIEKGYMTFAAFIERLSNLNKELNFKEKSLVMHFRITTSGGTKPENCHPFPISNKVEDLKATSIITEDVAMAHNGIISTYSGVLENDKLSDTQLFVQRAVYPIYQLDHEFYKNEAIMNLFEDIVSTDRLCFLDKDENLYFKGSWQEEDGVMYSNSSYKPYVYTSYSYSSSNSYNYDYDYDDWDDYFKPAKKTDEEIKALSISGDKYNEELKELLEDISENYVLLEEGMGFVVRKVGELAWIDVQSDFQYCVDKDSNVYYIDFVELELVKQDTTCTSSDGKSAIYRVENDTNGEESLSRVDVDSLFSEKELYNEAI